MEAIIAEHLDAKRAAKDTTRSKYHNIKVTVDGRKYDSAMEARYYGILLDRLEAGEIRDLRFQPKYDIHSAVGKKVAYYKADFIFYDIALNKDVVIDVKGKVLPVYRLKRALVESEHGIEIVEVRC